MGMDARLTKAKNSVALRALKGLFIRSNPRDCRWTWEASLKTKM
jgi:hypothetical protein